MKEETKESITISLELLRVALTKGGVSIAIDNKNKALMFFDTDTYLRASKMDGFSVDIESLVR